MNIIIDPETGNAIAKFLIDAGYSATRSACSDESMAIAVNEPESRREAIRAALVGRFGQSFGV